MLEGRREPRKMGAVVRGKMAWMGGVAVGRSGETGGVLACGPWRGAADRRQRCV